MFGKPAQEVNIKKIPEIPIDPEAKKQADDAIAEYLKNRRD